MMTNLKAMAAVFLVAGLLMISLGWLADQTLAAQGGNDLSAATFQQFYQCIRPQPGESRWMDIPWLIDLHEARKKAAAEGKPLFVLSGGGATGIGAC